MEIRYVASVDDPLKIGKVYEESWKYAYRGIIPQDYLDSIPAGRWTSFIDHPDWKTLVCVEDGRIVGTSCFYFSRFEQFPGWGEVISLYLLPEYMGYTVHALSDCITSYDKKKLPEMMEYYASKGCTVDRLSEVM